MLASHSTTLDLLIGGLRYAPPPNPPPPLRSRSYRPRFMAEQQGQSSQ
jgi:hypothetical protein